MNQLQQYQPRELQQYAETQPQIIHLQPAPSPVNQQQADFSQAIEFAKNGGNVKTTFEFNGRKSLSINFVLGLAVVGLTITACVYLWTIAPSVAQQISMKGGM